MPVNGIALTTDRWIHDMHRRAMAEAYESVKPKSLGIFRITYYCPCAECCGKSDGITASGTVATEGRTVAADLPIGTKLIIGGHEYTVEDTGSAIHGKRIDIYLDSHTECYRRGVDYMEVFVK